MDFRSSPERRRSWIRHNSQNPWVTWCMRRFRTLTGSGLVACGGELPPALNGAHGRSRSRADEFHAETTAKRARESLPPTHGRTIGNQSIHKFHTHLLLDDGAVRAIGDSSSQDAMNRISYS